MLLFSEKTQSKKPILPARLTRILLLATFAHPNQYGHESECWAEGHHRCVQHPDSPTDILLVESEGIARDGLKRASGVPTRTGHQFRASGRKLWQNSRCHSWFTSINLRCGIVVSDPNNYYSGWKNSGYTPGETSLIGVGCGKSLFSPDA